jgi:hypothetical protein
MVIKKTCGLILVKAFCWFSRIAIFSVLCYTAAGQSVYLSGTVRDSSTYQVLSYVNVQHNTGKIITASDIHGFFSLRARVGDTLVFTRLGYQPYLFVPKENEWDLNIRLVETVRMLKDVTIYGNFEIHGNDQIQKSIREGAAIESAPFQNPTQKPGNDYTVQTFGPGYTFSGPFSKFSKDEVEKRKLQMVMLEQKRTSVYREVIHSEQVKEYLSQIFSLTEADYHKKLEAFAIKYPGAENLTTRKEVIDMLVVFFAQKDK